MERSSSEFSCPSVACGGGEGGLGSEVPSPLGVSLTRAACSMWRGDPQWQVCCVVAVWWVGSTPG